MSKRLVKKCLDGGAQPGARGPGAKCLRGSANCCKSYKVASWVGRVAQGGPVGERAVSRLQRERRLITPARGLRGPPVLRHEIGAPLGQHLTLRQLFLTSFKHVNTPC